MVEDYLLSREHRVGSAKARFFTQLGFDPQHWPALRDALLHFAREEAELGSATRFGQKYVVRGSIAGPSGRAEQIVVVWGSLRPIQERNHDGTLPRTRHGGARP